MKVSLIMKVLKKRRDQVKAKSDKSIYNAYCTVLDDLIDATDSCTGELYY